MQQKYRSTICLTLAGPLLTAATGPDAYGVDRSFHRNAQGDLIIPASHVKGRLRMAFDELGAYPSSHASSLEKAQWDLALSDSTKTRRALLEAHGYDPMWFGSPSEQGTYEPRTGLLDFSDFVCDSTGEPSRRTRVAITPWTMTADEHKLWEIEDRFASGMEIRFVGTVTFFAETRDVAQSIIRMLCVGLRWLPTMGSAKGVGFGRLLRVEMSQPVDQGHIMLMRVPWSRKETMLHLRIRPHEPLLIGGVKQRRTNFIRSESIIPGGLIKGALASGVNRAYGIAPISEPLSRSTTFRYAELAPLIKHFSHIRVSHAFPVQRGQPRPVKVPLSTVKIDGEPYDTALSSEDYPLIDGRAPEYAIDWKEPQDFFGAATPLEIFVTRTEIDDTTRRAREEQLFTYSYLCPHTDSGTDSTAGPIEWVCNVDFSAITPWSRRGVKVAFAEAVQYYLDRLGKLGTPVEVVVADGPAPPAMCCGDLIRDRFVVVTLQTDTVVLDPAAVRALAPTHDLGDLYQAFWAEISGGSLSLDDFYAQQTFKGGYLYHRYLGATERSSAPLRYRPYYLTCAGSVFRLKAEDATAARACLGQWLRQGVPLPMWAQNEYGSANSAWQHCPFVPENGYGELMVNLDWHWERGVREVTV